jgi:PRTRC genetic system protein B
MGFDHKENFIPAKVLKVYKGEDDTYYIEVHPVYNKKGVFSIGAGMPLTRKTLQKLLGAAMSDGIESIWWDNPIMPECILSFCQEKYKRHIMWWRPARSIEMLFTDTAKLQSGTIRMPAMLFFSHLDKIRIFALKENRRPTLKTTLYAAPLLNSIADNHLCWGNVSNQVHNVIQIDKEIDTWENYLWNSQFSHGGSAKVTKKTAVMTLYKRLLETKKPFPPSELVNTFITVGELLKSL